MQEKKAFFYNFYCVFFKLCLTKTHFFFCNKTPQKKPKLNIHLKKKKKPLAKILLAKQNLNH